MTLTLMELSRISREEEETFDAKVNAHASLIKETLPQELKRYIGQDIEAAAMVKMKKSLAKAIKEIQETEPEVYEPWFEQSFNISCADLTVTGLKNDDHVTVHILGDNPPAIVPGLEPQPWNPDNFNSDDLVVDEGDDIIVCAGTGTASWGAVHLDTVNGTPGTNYPVGTAEHPVDNLEDAIAIAEAHGFTIERETVDTINDGGVTLTVPRQHTIEELYAQILDLFAKPTLITEEMPNLAIAYSIQDDTEDSG